MSQITCVNCGTELKAEHVNIQKLVGICPKCSHVFSLEPLIVASNDNPSKRDKVKRPEIFEVEERHDYFRVSYLWRRGADRFLMILLGFLPIIGGLGLSALGASDSEGAVTLAVFGLGLMLMGVYVLLSLALNRSTLVLDKDELTVKGTPLYFPLVNARLKLSDVDRIKTVPSKMNADPEQDLHTVFIYKRGGRRIRFMAGLSLNEAQYLVQQLSYYVQQVDAEDLELGVEGQRIDSDHSLSIQLGEDGEIISVASENASSQAALKR